MNHLVPCPGCRRHVRASEPECPFCALPLELAGTPAPRLPDERLSRAAMLAFSATLASATALVACGLATDAPVPHYGAPPMPEGGSAGVSSGGTANVGSAGSGTSGASNGFGGGPVLLYGAPADPGDSGGSGGSGGSGLPR